MNVAEPDRPQTDAPAPAEVAADVAPLPPSDEELIKVKIEPSLIESFGLSAFALVAAGSPQMGSDVAPIPSSEQTGATEATSALTVEASASSPTPMYRVLEKEISQSTVVSTEEGAHSSQFSQGEGALPSPRSPKKGWPNSSVKQSVSRSLTGRGSESIYKKPAHSYSSLITEAVRMSVKGQMTLNEIYCWLIDKFPYFRAAGTGWKV